MKFLIKKTPDRFIKSINDEITSILNRNFDSFFPEYVYNDTSDYTNKLIMPVELCEKENEYKIKAELPGVAKENLDIVVDKNHLTINAKKEEDKKEDVKGYRKSEFNYGEYSRTVYFPEEIELDKTKAKLENGILYISVPKREGNKEGSKKIEIE